MGDTMTNKPKTIATQASEASDAGTLLALLSAEGVTPDDARYITGRLQTLEANATDDRVYAQIHTMGHVGESLVRTAILNYDAGLVKDGEGKAIVLSSDDRA